MTSSMAATGRRSPSTSCSEARSANGVTRIELDSDAQVAPDSRNIETVRQPIDGELLQQQRFQSFEIRSDDEEIPDRNSPPGRRRR